MISPDRLDQFLHAFERGIPVLPYLRACEAGKPPPPIEIPADLTPEEALDVLRALSDLATEAGKRATEYALRLKIAEISSVEAHRLRCANPTLWTPAQIREAIDACAADTGDHGHLNRGNLHRGLTVPGELPPRPENDWFRRVQIMDECPTCYERADGMVTDLTEEGMASLWAEHARQAGEE